MAQLSVLIIGAGVAGNALAFWLSKVGHDVTVIERYEALRTNGLQVDLRGNGITVMRRMGLEEPVRAKCVPEEGIQMVDSSGRRRAFFAANRSGKGPQSFSSEYEIMRGDLCFILYEAASKHGAKYIFGSTLTSYKERDGKVEVSLTDGKQESFDLLVGCDGQSSRVRRLMLGGGQTLAEGQDTGLVTLGHRIAYYTMPRAAKEGEKYIASGYMMPGKRFVLTRRSNDASIQVYLTCNARSGPTASMKRGDVKAEKEAFAETFQGGGWQTDDLVKELKEGAEDFYCQYSGLVKLDSWSKGHVVLVGDAGYCCPPDGFGTTVALMGAYVLAGEIQKACHGGKDGNAATGADATSTRDGISAALQGYQQVFGPYMRDIQKKYSPDPGFSDKLPSTPLTVGIMNRVVAAVAFMKLDKLAIRLMPAEGSKGWQLPEYEMMTKA